MEDGRNKACRKGGIPIIKFDKRFLPFMVYFVFVALLLLFTVQTNFNLSGVHYEFNQEKMTMTIEKGVWDKQVDERQVTAQEALEIMLPINKAMQLWKINIYTISLFAAILTALVYSPFRPKKNLKWYVFLYLVLLVSFVIWDFSIHQAVAEEIANALK